MMRLRIVLIYWVIAICFFMPQAAYAYIDPATTTYLIQIITAIVIMAGVSLSVFMYRFKLISARIKYGLYGLTRRVSAETADNPAVEYVLPDYVIDAEPYTPKPKKADGVGQLGYKGRLRAAVIPALSVSLSFILIGCTYLVVENPADIPFMARSVTPILLLTTAICFCLILLILPLFRGLVYELLISIVVAVLIAGYIQGNFMNMGLGELTGDAIDWSLHKGLIAVSTLVWILVFVITFLIIHKTKSGRRGLLVFVPILLVVIQVVALVSLVSERPNITEWNTNLYWSQEAPRRLTINKIAEPAAERNAIVFVLDRFDQNYIYEILEKDPQFFDELDGFTMFDDNISYSDLTFPSVAELLTGHRYMWDRSRNDYFDYAWENAELIKALKARGVDIRLYMDYGYAHTRHEQLNDYVSNMLQGTEYLNKRLVLVKLLKLSAFRYAPMPAKPMLWLSPTEFNHALIISDETSAYFTDDLVFYDRITPDKLSLSDDKTAFIYYHLRGFHTPYEMDENIKWSENATAVGQGTGAMKVVYEYLRQLKEFGLYEDATIVITADHPERDGFDLVEPRLSALFVKPSGSAGTPLSVSHAPVTIDRLPGTIMEGLFGSSEGFAPGYMDAREGDDIRREYALGFDRYEIVGDGRDLKNWRWVDSFTADFELTIWDALW